MFWFIPAISGAMANAAYFIATKRLLSRMDPANLAAGGFFTAGFFLLAFAVYRGIPPAGNGLIAAVAATTILNTLATTLVFRALSETDISLAVPMLSFTPIFLLITSFLLLGEIPTSLGIAGIGVIVTGSYVLNLSSRNTSWLDPVYSVIRNRGTASMLVVAFIYAISLNFDKIVVLESDPVFGSSLVYLALGVSFCLIGRFRVLCTEKDPGFPAKNGLPDPAAAGVRKNPDEIIRAGVPAFILIGIILMFEAVSINYAFTMQITPYVIAIKRMSIIMTVFYGTLIAREGEIVQRLAGAVLMVGGAVLILLSG